LAIGASTRRCVGELSKLYDRALRSHARTVGIATPGQEGTLFAACDRAVRLIDENACSSEKPIAPSRRVMEVPLRVADAWEQVLALLVPSR
jgi:hypothetical protein